MTKFEKLMHELGKKYDNLEENEENIEGEENEENLLDAELEEELKDENISALTIRDVLSIIQCVPVSGKEWLNQEIKKINVIRNKN